MKKLSLFIILVLAIGAIFIFWQDNEKFTPQDLSSDINKKNNQAGAVPHIPEEGWPYYYINFQFSETENINIKPYPIPERLNLEELTKNASEHKGWNYQSEDYGDMGILVTQIRDKENGQDQKYWQYFVNGEQPQISVDKYFPKAGAQIEWKFIKSEF